MENMKAALEFDQELVAGNLKAAMSTAGAKSRDLWYVPVDQLKVMPGFNPRIKDDKYTQRVRKIADSIKLNGYYPDKPLAVIASDEIYVVEGGTRFDAVHLAISEGYELVSVPCVTKDRSTSMEDLTVGLAQGNDGERFTPFEMAIVVKRLVGYGWDTPKIAEKLQITPKYVEDLKALMGAPLKIREWVQAGTVSADVALSTLRRYGNDAVRILEGAVVAARSTGKNKATAKDLPGAARTKYLKSSAPKAFAALEQVQQHTAFAKLPDDLKALITGLLKDAPSQEEPSKKGAETSA